MTRWGATFLGLIALLIPACEDSHPGVTRVACVGDSITDGGGVVDRNDTYPMVLQRLLGATYDVRNFGDCGSALLTQSDKPYRHEKAYRLALEFRPDVVVILLGTNDSKPWNWQHSAQFKADYASLVHSFQELRSRPRVFVCTPVPAYPGEMGINDDCIRTEVKPRVEEVGRELNLPVIDLYTSLSGKPELFPDRVHPNEAGRRLMAEVIARVVAGQ
jgi:lysophospholipase L1-like esterase